MSIVNEKILLSFANLARLRWEFVDLAKSRDRDTGKITSYYTIKELLDKEHDSIMEDMTNKGGKKEKKRVFFNLEVADDPDNPTSPLYANLATFKKTFGIGYEYYEKWRDHKNPEGNFFEEWEVFYAADSYQIVADYTDLCFKKNNFAIKYTDSGEDYLMMYGEDGKIFKYARGLFIKEDKINKKDKEKFRADHANMVVDVNKNIKQRLYATRSEVEKTMKDKARAELLSLGIDVLGILIPYGGTFLKNNKSFVGKTAYLMLNKASPLWVYGAQLAYGTYSSSRVSNSDTQTNKAEQESGVISPLLYNNKLSMEEKEFGVLVLRKGNQYVIVFRHKDYNGEFNNRMAKDLLAHEIGLIDILFRQLLPIKGIEIKGNSNIILTGFGMGAEVVEIALLYNYAFYDFALKTKVFKAINRKSHERILNVSPRELPNLYGTNFDSLLTYFCKSTFNIKNKISENLGVISIVLVPGPNAPLSVVLFLLPKLVSVMDNISQNAKLNSLMNSLVKAGILSKQANGTYKVIVDEATIEKKFKEIVYHCQLVQVTGENYKLSCTGTLGKGSEIGTTLLDCISYTIDSLIYGASESIKEKESDNNYITHTSNSSYWNDIINTKISSYYKIVSTGNNIYKLQKYQRIDHREVKFINITSDVDGTNNTINKTVNEYLGEYDKVDPIGVLIKDHLKAVYKMDKNRSKALANHEVFYIHEEVKDKNAEVVQWLKIRKSEKAFLNYSIKTSQLNTNFLATEYIFWPYIGTNGKLELTSKTKDGKTYLESSYKNLNINYVISALRGLMEDVWGKADKERKGRNFYNEVEKGLKGDEDKRKYNEYFLTAPNIPDLKNGEFETLYNDKILEGISQIAVGRHQRQGKHEFLFYMRNNIYYIYDIHEFIKDSSKKSEIMKYMVKEKTSGIYLLDNIKFGFKDGSRKYNQEPIQYLYTPENIKIYRGLLVFNYSYGTEKSSNLENDVVSKIYNGAKVKCDKGGGESSIKATSASGISGNDGTVATSNDKTLNKAFESCNGNNVCQYSLEGSQWQNTAKDAAVASGGVYLIPDSYIVCATNGGKITFENPNEDSGSQGNKVTDGVSK